VDDEQVDQEEQECVSGNTGNMFLNSGGTCSGTFGTCSRAESESKS